MSGHGHVTPNADGSKARCGGPAICSVCALEFARLHMKVDAAKHVFPERLTVRDTTVTADEGQRIYTTASGHGYEKCEYVRADLALITAPHGFKWALVTDYPTGPVTGACICGSWPGGECLRCPPLIAKAEGR